MDAAYIALLRGINVGGHRKIPMAALRALCADLGWTDVRSYIQSGNVVFRARGASERLETSLEEAVAARFGFDISILVRPATDWPAYVAGNPFAEASAHAPNRVMLALSKAPPKEDAEDRLRAYAVSERVTRVCDALWIHYADGAGRTKLSPALVDRLVGSPVTARNWRTVRRLDEMAAALR